jgi:hypothetical protein
VTVRHGAKHFSKRFVARPPGLCTSIVLEELKGRAFEIGAVAFDLRKPGDKQGPDIPDSAYLELLDSQLKAKGRDYVALAKMFPAVAVVIAATAQALQQGKTLDEIKVYPQGIEAGTMISPDLFNVSVRSVTRALRGGTGNSACEPLLNDRPSASSAHAIAARALLPWKLVTLRPRQTPRQCFVAILQQLVDI